MDQRELRSEGFGGERKNWVLRFNMFYLKKKGKNEKKQKNEKKMKKQENNNKLSTNKQ